MKIRANGINMHYELATAIPGAQLEIIPGAAHLSNIEQAAVFSRLLLDFPGV